jgi:hypothetical protein
MSLIANDAPGPLQPPVPERDLEAEVAHCVGGVITHVLFNNCYRDYAQANAGQLAALLRT